MCAGGGRTSRPALSLRQFTHLFEGGYHRELGAGRHLDANLQYEYINNDNLPETGILPLIPNYNSGRGSAYVAFHEERDRFQFHAGLRYDYQRYEAIVQTAFNRIERFDHQYRLLGGSLESRYQASDALSLRGGITYRARAPQINELYSFGLHQGVSGIEEGDPDLEVERALKASFSALLATSRYGVNATIFAQPISNYIFLEPQPERRQTIRGAFPLFRYRGADALLYGLNLQGFYQVSSVLKLSGALSQVQGRETGNGRGLVYIPPPNFRAAATYTPAGPFEGWDFGLELYTVLEQTQITEEQDFLPPPGAYSLLDFTVSHTLDFPNGHRLDLRATAHNALNTAYRDYLDRQRYYADAPGRNVELAISYQW